MNGSCLHREIIIEMYENFILMNKGKLKNDEHFSEMIQKTKLNESLVKNIIFYYLNDTVKNLNLENIIIRKFLNNMYISKIYVKRQNLKPLQFIIDARDVFTFIIYSIHSSNRKKNISKCIRLKNDFYQKRRILNLCEYLKTVNSEIVYKGDIRCLIENDKCDVDNCEH